MTLALTKELIELNNSPVEGSNARAEGNAAPPRLNTHFLLDYIHLRGI